MFSRTECVICSGELHFTFERKKYPITVNPPDISESHELDKYCDQLFYTCMKCSCVQLGNLIDPSLLYKDNHNNTYNTPTWKEHHEQFSRFILKSGVESILELGGNGILFKVMNNPHIRYSCLDMYDPIDKIDGIQYYQGNCEEYEYPKGSTIVMSHVFEHLYNPRKFIKKIESCGIESVYISIPNMKQMIELNNPTIMNNEHTYYVDRVNLEWLFSQYNYELYDEYEFKRHSLFFCFRRNIHVHKQSVQNRSEIANTLSAQLQNIQFESIDMKPNSFIVPAGMFGQLLYYYKQPDIIGFIDNDTSKQNHRVYGTPHYVYDFTILLNYGAVTVYLLAGPYTSELKQQIHSINANVEVIEV